jgi:Mycothiol maleylpyruvate isomerase N-terminal domain
MMDTIAEIIKDNASQNAALRELVKRISDDDLSLPLEAGWTISAVLAHLAFWDQRAVTLIGKWKKDGVGPSPIDTDVVNEATRNLCLAIPPRKAAELAVELAAEVDKLIPNLTPEMLATIQTKGTTVKLRRADHRRTHLGEIEKVLEGRHK